MESYTYMAILESLSFEILAFCVDFLPAAFPNFFVAI